MFPFIGIQADEEPKTPISASGLYNSSSLTGSSGNDFVLDSTIIGGLSEFTFMAWFYLSPSNTSNFALYPYQENHSGFNSLPIYFFEDEIKTSIWNSNGGQSTTAYSTTTPINQWVHVVVTGSVVNGRIRLYLNGVLVSSSTMTYSNDVTTGAFFENYNFSTDDVDIAQVNTYNRELSETEVAEHYVYDDDTMTSGVLGWDAMTPAQRSGLIYSSSYTKDISISGNEFNDKSGNGTTISSQPPLTGEQIYFYTNASDLPSDTTIYNVNSATLVATSKQYFTTGDTPVYDFSGDFAFSIRARFNEMGTSKGLWIHHQNGDNFMTMLVTASDELQFQWYDEGVEVANIVTPLSVLANEWHTYTVSRVSGTITTYVDTSAQGTDTDAGSSTIEGLMYIGSWALLDKLYMNGSMYGWKIWRDTPITSTEVATIHNNGVEVCYDEFTLKTGLIAFIRLGNYDGNAGDELVDKTGTFVPINAINTPTYTNQGLTVECVPSTPVYNSLNYGDANWDKRYSFVNGVESTTIDETGWYFNAPNGEGSSQYHLDQFNDGTVSGDFEIVLSTDQVEFTSSTSGSSQRYFSLILWDDTFADRYFTGFGRKIADETTGQTTHYFNDVTSAGGFDTSFAVDSTIPRTIGVKRVGTTLQFLLDGVVQRTETVTAFNNFSFRILLTTQNTAQYARGYVTAFEVKDGNGVPYYDGDGFPLSDYFRNQS